LSSYSQLDEVAFRASQIALSYKKCEDIVREKRLAGITEISYQVERVKLLPGRREVLLRILFGDGDGLRVLLDVDNAIIYWVKNYW
jgi:hypothetical protein